MEGQEITRKRKRDSIQKSSNLGTNAANFAKRCRTIQKKAYELSTLCSVDVGVICYGPGGSLHTWPEDRTNVRDIAMKFKRLDDKRKTKRRLNLADFSNKSCSNGSKFQSLDERFDGYSKEKLIELDNILLSKIGKLQERIELLKQQEQDNAVPVDESHREEELNKLPHPEPDDQFNLSDLTGQFDFDFDFDFDFGFEAFGLEESGSNNIDAIVPLQNQALNYSDMSENINISNVNSLVPVEHVAANAGYNYCQSSVPQMHYPDLSAESIDTPCSYNHSNPVHNNVSMGTAEEAYMCNEMSQYVNNPAVLNNGNFRAGSLMVSNSFQQGLPAISWTQNEHSYGNPSFRL